MEQIKRMLVNQRGFIVQALKQLTESNSSNTEIRQKFTQQIKEQKDTIEQLTTEANEVGLLKAAVNTGAKTKRLR